MRTALLAALVIALGAPAGAQSRGARSHQSGRATDEVFRPSIGLPLPPIGLPLPSIGLPLPPMGLQPRTPERLERSARSERAERPERSERFGRSRGATILFGPVYGWPYPYEYLSGTPEPSPPTPPPAPQAAIGRLHLDLPLDVNPQVYVDGYYAGLLSDANGAELTLDAGPHTIELHQDGYETLREDVRIPFGNVITYRGELKRLLPAQPAAVMPPVPPPAPATIYMIPRCYVGNIPPSQALLPAGCDARDAVEFPPAR
jgi:hypothetical protein